MMNNGNFIGIDVGKNGGISVVDYSGNVISSFVTPTLPSGDIDVLEMYCIMAHVNHVSLVVIEKVHAIFGASAGTTFEFGRSAGIAEGVVCAARLPYMMVPPKEWQKEMWAGVTKVIKSGKKSVDTKATSLSAVKRLFPDAKLHDQSKPMSLKVHDGIVDSILMAEYARRIWVGRKR